MATRTRKKRPHVAVNMAMSLDGRITTRRRERFALGTRHDRRLMDVLRAENDAVIVGAGTVRHDGYPILVRDDTIRRRRIRDSNEAHPLNVVLSRALDLSTRTAFFAHKETRRIVYTTSRATRARITRFSRLAEVVVLPGRALSPVAVLDDLRSRGCRKVLLEGGGEVHFAFVRDDLVDEIYVTVTPRLIGGVGTPTILDGKGFLHDEHIRLRLAAVKRVGDELFLRYRVIRRGPPASPGRGPSP